MRFSYAKCPATPDPIDGSEEVYRPQIIIGITHKNLRARFLATIDSGADMNMAPVELADVLGIDLSNFPSMKVHGIENTEPVSLFFASVTLSFGSELIHTYMGFGGNLPTILLGQKGFFDKCKEVNFVYPKHIEIKVKH